MQTGGLPCPESPHRVSQGERERERGLGLGLSLQVPRLC